MDRFQCGNAIRHNFYRHCTEPARGIAEPFRTPTTLAAAAVDGSASKEHAVANLYTVQHIGDKSVNSNMQGNVGLLAPALPVTAWLPNANSQPQTVKA